MFWNTVKNTISPRPNDATFNLQLGMCASVLILIGYNIPASDSFFVFKLLGAATGAAVAIGFGNVVANNP